MGDDVGDDVTIGVLLADDQELVRAGFRMILEAEDDMRVVAEIGDGEATVAAAHRLGADVVLMDIEMPGVDGIEATRRIVTGLDGPRVLILTTFERDDYILDAMRAGASGFLVKTAPPDELVTAIRVVARGDAMLSPSVTRRLIERVAEQTPPALDEDGLEPLTDREREVLVLVARGRSNREIADALYVSEGTVKTHLSRTLTKLGLRDRVQAAVFAYEVGLVRPGKNDTSGG